MRSRGARIAQGGGMLAEKPDRSNPLVPGWRAGYRGIRGTRGPCAQQRDEPSVGGMTKRTTPAALGKITNPRRTRTRDTTRGPLPKMSAAPRVASVSLAPSLMSRALQQFLVLMLRDLFPAFLDHAAHAIPPFYDQTCDGYTSRVPGLVSPGSSSEDPTTSLPSRRIWNFSNRY